MEEKETADSNLEAIEEELEEQAASEQEGPDAVHKAHEEKNEEYEEALNRLYRLQADFDNYKKRVMKQQEEYYKYASDKLIVSLLPVLDNFERALTAEGDGQEFKEGVDMIYKQLNEALTQEGLSKIDAVANEFDPNQHQAVMQVESEEHPENTVIEELQKGYKLKDKVIRYSMVKVAKN